MIKVQYQAVATKITIDGKQVRFIFISGYFLQSFSPEHFPTSLCMSLNAYVYVSCI